MSPADEPRAKPARRVLVVDDEPGYREMLSIDLTAEGFEVSVAADGMEAMTVLGERPFDAVVTDMKMPRMDGLDTVKAIKAYHRHIPIVLMTGYCVGDRVEKALQLKASACLKKPFDLGDLLALLRRLLPP